MTICPIALLVGCRKCPAFTVCPLKAAIGDYTKPAATEPKPEAGGDQNGAKPAEQSATKGES